MANKFLGEAGIDQLVNEIQQRYDKLDSFMVLDPSNRSKCMQTLLSYVLAPTYCPLLFIKDVKVTMSTLIGVGSDVTFIKSPGTVSPIICSTPAAILNFNDVAIGAICDNFVNSNPGDVLTTLKYKTPNKKTSKPIALFNVTKSPSTSTALDNPIAIVIDTISSYDNDFETLLNQEIERYGADSGTIIENFSCELVKAGNVVQIEDSLFAIKNSTVGILELIPLEITAAEVTNKFNS